MITLLVTARRHLDLLEHQLRTRLQRSRLVIGDCSYFPQPMTMTTLAIMQHLLWVEGAAHRVIRRIYNPHDQVLDLLTAATA